MTRNSFLALSCAFSSVLATSCVNDIAEEPVPGPDGGYHISLTGEVNEDGVSTRAHWDTNNDENQSLDFTWDASENEMKSFVRRNDAFVDFIGSKKYSDTKVSTTETKNQAQLQITAGLSVPYAEGDVIWSVSPLTEANVDGDSKVTFTLPDSFTQTELNSTEHLKSYVLMSGTGTVNSNNTASIKFDVLPAIYRFKVINNEAAELTVNGVSISGPFCNKAELVYGEAPTYSVANGTYNIKVAAPEAGLKVSASSTAYLYALVFPTATSTISDEITLSFTGKYGDLVADYSVSAACNTIYNYNLDSNKYYDMDVPVSKPALFAFTEDANLKSLGYGQSYQIKYDAADGATIEWSSNSDILTVSETGMIKVNTLVGGDAKITAKVTKGSDTEEYTVDATVAKGRFDFSFGEGLSPWYLDTSGASVKSSGDGKTTVQMTSGDKHRGDIRLVKDKDLCVDAGAYPILAVKITAPDNWNAGNNNSGCFKFEIHNDNSNTYGLYYGDMTTGNNSFTLLQPKSIVVGEPIWIYFDLRKKFEKSDTKLPAGPETLRQLKFVIADNKQLDTYDIYWVKSFASVEDLQSFVASETAAN